MKFKSGLSVPNGNGSKNFLKLKPSESVYGIFMGDPYEFYSLWENGRGKDVPEGTAGSSFRFRINFVVKDGAVYVPKIFENGVTVYNQLKELHEEYALDTIVVKITRNGSGKETSYSIIPANQKLTKETLAHLKTLQLNELVSQAPQQNGQTQDNEEIPF